MERWLLDLKTNEKGIFAETALQLAAYRFADKYVDEDGVEQDMIPVQRTGAIHITTDTAQLIPTTCTEAQLRTFWYAGQVADFTAAGRDLIGEAIQPTSATAPLSLIYREETAS